MSSPNEAIRFHFIIKSRQSVSRFSVINYNYCGVIVIYIYVYIYIYILSQKICSGSNQCMTMI